ncbi:PREDICTED: uncharacterized protein LOC109233548 [Nicotiana attenuata]|uniref:uncharacterized protein LOC109233548 n=1 Tax=Nicotiana attenuata TaxID=49451 RepID=UPI0009048694|nr:PREDICTED: uncharacterized protein LOC109233548 [Nicotiana attenuata]
MIPEILNSKKRVKKLTWRIAALSRFISRSSNRCHKFFSVLKKDRRLQRNEECIEALRKLKVYLSSPPLLVKADPGECLLVYLALSEVAVIAVLVRENKGMKLAIKYRARRLILHCDSQLVVNQVARTYQIKEQRLQKYQSEIHKLMPEFDECRFEQIPRGQNIEADSLAKLAAATKNINKENVVTLLHSAVDHIEVFSLKLNWDWRNQFVSYLQDGTLPRDKKAAKKLRMQAARYSLINHDLYKKMFGGPLAKCLGPHQTRQVLEEVHEGHCGAHTGNRTLVRCLIRTGYYWPTMKKEAAYYVRRCEQCQKYAPMIHQAGELLHSVTSPWPFIKWGMDIIGPLPAGRGKVRMHRKITEFFEKWLIKRILSTPYHPAANGQAESSNKTILNILKKKLEEAKGLWPELLPEVLWAYRTTPKSSTRETPYSLVYETDAVIPVEIGEPSLRYSHTSGADNDESKLQDLEEAEERRDMAHIRMTAQK